MQTRRTPPRRRPRDDSPGTRRFLIGGGGVVVLGILIGSFIGHHGTKPPHPHHIAKVHANVSHAPVALPIAAITFKPVSSARPATAAPHASGSPSASPQPRHTRYPVTAAMLEGNARRTAAPAATPEPATPAPTPSVTPEPSATPVAAHHRPAKTPEPVATATPAHAAALKHRVHHVAAGVIATVAGPRLLSAHHDTALPQAPVSTPQAIAVHPKPAASQVRHAESIVRGYLGALTRGDENTAYHYLGASAGDPNASLSEEIFIDHSTRVTSVVAQSDGSAENVQAEVQAKHGLYFLTFRVEPRGGRQIITSHDFIKP